MKDRSKKIVLGIESSCDETGLAVLSFSSTSNKPTVLAEVLHSQIDIHKEYGGVVPELAAREHLVNLPLLFERVLKDAEISIDDVDLIGVTTGPGLKGCLLCGMLFASGIAEAKSILLVPVNHVEAHVLSVFIDNPELAFPFLSLIVSGGHTELHYVQAVGQYTLLARTIDDAAGEAFDKSAKLMGLPYPGGPELAKLADSFNSKTSSYELPKVMLHQNGFSFSGLKTAIALLLQQEAENLEEITKKSELAWTIQESIVDALVRKVQKATELTGCSTLSVCGGVSANRRLRENLQSSLPDLKCLFPAVRHCVDNGTMIALTAHLRTEAGLSSKEFKASPRWPIETATREEI